MENTDNLIKNITNNDFSAWLNKEIIEESGKGFLVITPRGLLVYANHEMCKITGIDCDRFIGKNIFGDPSPLPWFTNLLKQFVNLKNDEHADYVEMIGDNNWIRIHQRTLSRKLNNEDLILFVLADIATIPEQQLDSRKLLLRVILLLSNGRRAKYVRGR